MEPTDLVDSERSQVRNVASIIGRVSLSSTSINKQRNESKGYITRVSIEKLLNLSVQNLGVCVLNRLHFAEYNAFVFTFPVDRVDLGEKRVFC